MSAQPPVRDTPTPVKEEVPPARETSPSANGVSPPTRNAPPPSTRGAPPTRAGIVASEMQKDIEDNRAVFSFYSKSADVYPGKGAGESLPPCQEHKYDELSKIPGWRKMLSNFYESPIEIDGLTWASVEHYYQASKFKKENREFYEQFSLESGTALSKDPVMAKGAGGKTGKSGGKQLRPTHIKADADFFEGRDTQEMHLAQDAKFQDRELARMLRLTGDAILMHNMGRGKYIRFLYVETLRDSM